MDLLDVKCILSTFQPLIQPNEDTRRLCVEEGGFKYDSDAYNDDLPYWNMDFDGKLHLVIPYTLDMNDMRFTVPNGYANGEEFARDLKENLRYLVDEGRAGGCKMMTVGLHCRLARPGRCAAIAEFIDFAKSYGREVWICTREEIANHWFDKHFPKGAGSPMSSGGALPEGGELDIKRSGSNDALESSASAADSSEAAGDDGVAAEDDGDII